MSENEEYITWINPANDPRKDDYYHIKPYYCPICRGRGTVDGNFYDNFGSTTSNSEVTCKTCHGKGIVWG